MIRVGVAGWDYPDWEGVVYPKPRPRGFDPLVLLAEILDAVEVNATFYRIPAPSSAASWVRRTRSRPEFRLTVKLPGTFTHALTAAAGLAAAEPSTGPALGAVSRARVSTREQGADTTSRDGIPAETSRPTSEPSGSSRENTVRPDPEPPTTLRESRDRRSSRLAAPSSEIDPDREAAQFREAIAPLADAGRLGAVLVQFPQSFHDGERERAHVSEVLERFSGLPLVVEFRHAGWETEETAEILRRHGAGFCNIDQPRIASTLGPTSLVTSRIGYVRLHGRNAAAWFRAGAGRDNRYDYLYASEELTESVETAQQIAREGADTFVILNNHFRGKAVVNALQIKAALEGGLVRVPEPLEASYPVLSKIAKAPEGRLPF